MKKIRTRYAPSPTGYLHIGGARTALFCYLFAKHFQGDFIFRLEDTDVKREVVGGEKSQLDNLAWLGIIPDESPLKPNEKYGKYRQSEKLKRYAAIAKDLVNKGFAYKAYDNAQELEAQKAESDAKGIPSFRYDRNWLKISQEEKQRRDLAGEYSIRFIMPKDVTYTWNDIVRGEISFKSDDIGDWVIQKSDGYPTYNFAVVVDDYDMQISHVLRGEEHITNTPKQLAIYNALGWEHPEYGHLTIITNMEGKKLSKRDTSLKQFIEDYRNEGYAPEGIFNFLTLLGWTDSQAREVLNHEELITAFDPQRFSKSPSKFDIQKMQWFSKQYLKAKSSDELIELLNLENSEWMHLFINTFKENVYTTSQLLANLNTYQNPLQTKPELNAEQLEVVKIFAQELENVEFKVENIQETINKTALLTGKKGKNLFMPIRLATTFVEHGPELAKAIYLFGADIVKERLNLWK
ncbi:glutamyl-tRNA synthetase [Mycoplasmopsis columbina SF7]|uniref:Glutamate--tRNA ligase n=1 Tax=Mycoplasmopsis columbina SF7 TaxID=1037410 RepID=F9UK00_9BACT|nr:glutamate--tRNA ligase [Mycoplasmopsis columbina]EGV00346.1 glutamyl-tRNA synthetase [Mycoplasmopsis columbina SF7]